jgi:hypothetical protein
VGGGGEGGNSATPKGRWHSPTCKQLCPSTASAPVCVHPHQQRGCGNGGEVGTEGQTEACVERGVLKGPSPLLKAPRGKLCLQYSVLHCCFAGPHNCCLCTQADASLGPSIVLGCSRPVLQTLPVVASNRAGAHQGGNTARMRGGGPILSKAVVKVCLWTLGM